MATPYQEALADPAKVEIGPGLIMRPFHLPISGMEQEWHVYCAVHESFGFCGVEERAREIARHHRQQKHPDPRDQEVPDVTGPTKW